MGFKRRLRGLFGSNKNEEERINNEITDNESMENVNENIGADGDSKSQINDIYVKNYDAIEKLNGSTEGRLIVVSALEGNLDDYKKYLSLWDENDPNCHIAFLGNLIFSMKIDDGSIEILDDAIEKSKKYDNFHYLLGIHELSCIMDEDVMKMGVNLNNKFKDLISLKKGSLEPYLSQYINFFKSLPYFIKTDNGLFISYSGPSKVINSSDDLNNIDQDLNLAHDLLWARAKKSIIGVGYETSDVDKFLDNSDLKFMIVGNEPCYDGYEIFSRQLIFSSGLVEKKTYLDIDLSENIDSMSKLFDCLNSEESIGNSIYNDDSQHEKTSKYDFKYLDDLIHSGLDDLIHNGVKEIILDSDIVLGNDEYSSFKGIKLDLDGIVIDGNGHTIDACGKARIFKCMGKNIKIKNITLKNGFTKENGGAIHNEGELTISDSKLVGNFAQGGLIKGGGGAISNSGKLTIKGSSLNENSTYDYGGAIHNEGELSLRESTFNGNSSRQGGAIYNSKNLKVFNCEFSNNKSPFSIISNFDSFELKDSVFMFNQASNIILNDGVDSTFYISKGEFIDNNLTKSVIYNIGKLSTIKKVTFENNISNSDSLNIINITDLTLISPIISEKSRTILNEGHILIKDAVQDIESKIYGNGDVEYIPIYEGKKFDFAYFDKIIHESDSNEIVLKEDICLENYEYDFYEGGIDLDINNLIIDGNGHTIDGANKSRIFIITGNNITLKNITFKNGYSHKKYENFLNSHGGAIKINNDIDLTIVNCKFENNTSQCFGGAIHNKGDLSLRESTFNGNSSRQGGAIHNKGDLSLRESTFNINTANGGGAIHNEGVLTISNSVLVGNFAQDESISGGGAIHNEGELTIIESTLNENKAQREGGSIMNCGDLTIMESTLNKNTVNKVGGAISNRDGGELTISNSVLVGNFAQGEFVSGGAIFNYMSKLTITRSMLNGNVGGHGGAIDNRGELTITGSTLNENIAEQYNGGAISNWDDGELTITESTLIKNKALNYGGAIMNDGNLTITESTLIKNKAQKGGGAIVCIDKEKVKLNNCTFNDNEPEDIYEDLG